MSVCSFHPLSSDLLLTWNQTSDLKSTHLSYIKLLPPHYMHPAIYGLSIYATDPDHFWHLPAFDTHLIVFMPATETCTCLPFFQDLHLNFANKAKTLPHRPLPHSIINTHYHCPYDLFGIKYSFLTPYLSESTSGVSSNSWNTISNVSAITLRSFIFHVYQNCIEPNGLKSDPSLIIFRCLSRMWNVKMWPLETPSFGWKKAVQWWKNQHAKMSNQVNTGLTVLNTKNYFLYSKGQIWAQKHIQSSNLSAQMGPLVLTCPYPTNMYCACVLDKNSS